MSTQTRTGAARNRRLPPEILSLIFKYTVKSSLPGSASLDDSLLNKRNITNVCLYWRQVAFGTQALWKSMTLPFLTPNHLAQMAHTLRVHLRNSGRRRLKMSLVFTGAAHAHGRVNFPNLVHSSVDEDLLANSDRIARLTLKKLPPLMTAAWLERMPQFSGLSTLEVEGGHNTPIDLSRNPTIHSLIFSWTPGPISVTRDNIRSLTLHCVPVDTCARLLFACRNLESYNMTTPLPRRHTTGGSMPPPDKIITLSNLKDLTWDFSNSEFDEDVLNFLDAPALQNLYWQQIGRWELEAPHINFFERLPRASLKYIEIDAIYENEDGAEGEDNLLSVIPIDLEIETLCLVCDTFKALLDSASYLVPPTGQPYSNPFPSLTNLHLTSVNGDDQDLDRDHLLAFLDIICQRVGPDRHLHILFCGTAISCTRLQLPNGVVDMLEREQLIIEVDGTPF